MRIVLLLFACIPCISYQFPYSFPRYARWQSLRIHGLPGSFVTRTRDFIQPISNISRSGYDRLFGKNDPRAEEKSPLADYVSKSKLLGPIGEQPSVQAWRRNESTARKAALLLGRIRDHAALALKLTRPMERVELHPFLALSVRAASAINSTEHAKEFLEAFGLESLLQSITSTEDNTDGIAALHNLLKHSQSLEMDVAITSQIVDALCDSMEAPLKKNLFRRSNGATERLMNCQYAAVGLVHRLVRFNRGAAEHFKQFPRLLNVLGSVAVSDDSTGSSTSEPFSTVDSGTPKRRKRSGVKRVDVVVPEYTNLSAAQMARVAMWGIGGVSWRPRQPGQRGLRVLSFDGGGTKGVMSAAVLGELWRQLGYPAGTRPCDVFDVICGTSTGGILAGLLGLQQRNLTDTEELYGGFVDHIFSSRSNLKLLHSKALYDETALEAVLRQMCGDQLLLDSNQRRGMPRVFCVSTKVTDGAAWEKTHLWRNYNYPPGVQPRHSGTAHANTFTAIRATTAAPTYFMEVPWEGNLYLDGAVVANNPAALAVQEAKLLFPEVPIELVVSIGTGTFNNRAGGASTTTGGGGGGTKRLGWSRLLSQVVAASTDTEDVHGVLTHFLPRDRYFRLNPRLKRHYPIDEKGKEVLAELREVGRQYVRDFATKSEVKRFQSLVKVLGIRK